MSKRPLPSGPAEDRPPSRRPLDWRAARHADAMLRVLSGKGNVETVKGSGAERSLRKLIAQALQRGVPPLVVARMLRDVAGEADAWPARLRLMRKALRAYATEHWT